MQDITERIFKGAIAVFLKKGLQATTKEVAKEAGVAEVTLYRKYNTKENLFITSIKNILEKKFHSRIMDMATESDTEVFLMAIIEDRLTVLSKNEQLVKMLLSESLRGNLVNEINIPELIFTSLKNGLDAHFTAQNRNVDSGSCARQLAGIFLSYVIMPTGERFHLLEAAQKEALARKYAQSIIVIA